MLIYVAAILIFLVGLVVAGAREARLQSRVSFALQERLLALSRLQAGADWLAARLEVILAETRDPPATLAQLAMQPSTVEIDGNTVVVNVEDGDLKPDINRLTQSDWQRLFVLYGVDGPRAAGLVRIATDLLARAGPAGFTDVDQLALDPRMPGTLVDGYESVSGEWYPPLRDLVSAGGRRKRLHVESAHIALFEALIDATPEQFDAWRAARRTRRVTVADAELIFGAGARQLCYAGEPEMLRFRLALPGVSATYDLEVAMEGQRLRVRHARPAG